MATETLSVLSNLLDYDGISKEHAHEITFFDSRLAGILFTEKKKKESSNPSDQRQQSCDSPVIIPHYQFNVQSNVIPVKWKFRIKSSWIRTSARSSAECRWTRDRNCLSMVLKSFYWHFSISMCNCGSFAGPRRANALGTQLANDRVFCYACTTCTNDVPYRQTRIEQQAYIVAFYVAVCVCTTPARRG